MFDNPDFKRQLVDTRLEQRRHQAAARRLTRRSPRRASSGDRRPTSQRHWFRTLRPSWLARRRSDAPAPKPLAA